MRKTRSAALLACLAAVAASFTPVAASAQAPVPSTNRTLDEVFAETARLVPGFAGVVIDDSGAAQLQLTKAAPEVTASATDVLAALGHSEALRSRKITTRQVEFDFLKLKSWYDAMLAELPADLDVSMSDIDEANNQLWIGIADLRDESRVREVATRLGIPARALAVAEEKPVARTGGGNSSLQLGHRPLVGGLQISRTDGFNAWYCTLGYVAQRNGEAGIVTNAHCTDHFGGSYGTAFGQPTNATRVANEAVDPELFTGGPCPAGRRCRFSDAAFARLMPLTSATQGAIAVPANGNPSWDATEKMSVQTKYDPFVGALVAKVGRTTGLTRGKVEHTCADVRVIDTDISLLCQSAATYVSQPGDSGSAVVDTGGGGRTIAMGINWGSSTTHAFFSPISSIERELGALRVCAPSANC